ncbi:SMAD/FHA domain-containing protein [Pavlovales sp. CCMP2436]|nr:SMAD/FHA domain-containing protein [Pavlovales sp. CCMP2436]
MALFSRAKTPVWGIVSYSDGRSTNSVEVSAPEFTIGRSSQCSLALRNKPQTVSGVHCKLSIEPPEPDSATGAFYEEGAEPRVLLEDLSNNGTWLNSRRLTRGLPVELKQGDAFGIPAGVERDGSGEMLHFVFTDMRANLRGAQLTQPNTPYQQPYPSSPLSSPPPSLPTSPVGVLFSRSSNTRLEATAHTDVLSAIDASLTMLMRDPTPAGIKTLTSTLQRGQVIY